MRRNGKVYYTVDSFFFFLLIINRYGRLHCFLGKHYLDANKTTGEKARRQLHKNAASNIEQVLEATPHEAPTIQPPTSHHENYPS